MEGSRRVGDVMMTEVRSISPGTTVEEAARIMREEDVGSLPVVEDERLVGIVTDRDIAVRTVGEGKGPGTTVGEIASREIVTATPDQPFDSALELMARHQVRRLPVVEEGRVVGILAQADVALDASPERVAEVVEEISEPSQKHDT